MVIFFYIEVWDGVLDIGYFVEIYTMKQSIGNHQFSKDWKSILYAYASKIYSYLANIAPKRLLPFKNEPSVPRT